MPAIQIIFFPGNDIAFVKSMHQNLLEGAVPKAELSSQIDDMLDSIDAYLSAKDEG
ncbi:MAG: hypothetical protein GY805_05415 [Chloroflexi bacterium]|nr:hypothetical protein [Chloroflexota bacterium]